LEPFFTTKPLGQGTGLGLAQVFGVVAQSGGTMTINSRLGEGTKITLSLPACEEEEAAEVATSISSPAPQMLRLLVVDDDAAVRATIAGILMEDGHSVEAVASGASALTLLQENEYDLVVVDFLMPGMTGTELIKAVGEFREGVRFLLVSGYADSNEIANAREHADLLRKPFTPDELRRAMATASLAPRTAN
jgi:CheY-like chemotaxis protein